MANNKINLGNKVMVSDPCYGLGTWCQGVLENVKEGEYETSFTRMEPVDGRIESITVIHSENINDELNFELEEFDVGVDSGQAGIFDYEYYSRYHSDSKEKEYVNDRWYDKVCDLTFGFIKNDSYVPFTQKDEYKAGIMGLFKALQEVKAQYPELDTDKIYRDVIDHYEDLDKPVSKDDLKLDGLLETLRDIKDLLDKDYVPPVKSESEKALDDAKYKWERILHDSWNKYKDTKESYRDFYAAMASPIGGMGFVSSSGDGDGSYRCYTAKDNEGRIVAIKVDFNYYYDEEEYDEEDE